MCRMFQFMSPATEFVAALIPQMVKARMLKLMGLYVLVNQQKTFAMAMEIVSIIRNGARAQKLRLYALQMVKARMLKLMESYVLVNQQKTFAMAMEIVSIIRNGARAQKLRLYALQMV